MSAIAQYLADSGKNISGSDRLFSQNVKSDTQIMLEKKRIKCFPQDCSGITPDIHAVIISSAIEPTVPEYMLARKMNLPVIMRSDLLAQISFTKNTIAISGTSGKSTVTAMIYHIFNYAGLSPSLITGAGLVSLQKNNGLGNSVYGKGDFLIIEVDESDGSIVKYKAQTGIILNIDKDHKEIDELLQLFEVFKANVSDKLIVNRNCPRAKLFSQNINNDFDIEKEAGFSCLNFIQKNLKISFSINNTIFELSQPGKHNMENAAAAVAASVLNGISIETAAEALKSYQGILRRHQIIGTSNGVTIIDDYAHNPAKIAASIRACLPENGKLICWFQPHGFGPTRFLRHDFVKEIAASLREMDQIWMSEIYYAGGTAVKDISSADLISDLKNKNCNAFFVENRNDFVKNIINIISPQDIILLTGARDPSLELFAEQVFEEIEANYKNL